MSICLCLSIYLSICLYLSIYLIYLSPYLSIYLSIHDMTSSLDPTLKFIEMRCFFHQKDP